MRFRLLTAGFLLLASDFVRCEAGNDTANGRQRPRVGRNSDRLQVDGRSLALLALLELVAELLALIEIAHPGPLDRRDMHEHIGAAGLRLDEAEALLGVEPFDCPSRHYSTPNF